jgi:glycosyltransferase involved in cell wall biosynthesis
MRDGSNCRVVPDGDWRAAVARVLELDREPPARLRALIASARAAVEAYTEARMAAELARVFSGLAVRDGMTARVT